MRCISVDGVWMRLLDQQPYLRAKVPVASTMTHEYKLLKSCVFCWKLPVTSKEGELERNGKDGGRDFACEPLVLIALLQVSVSYIYSRVWHPKRAVAASKCEHYTQLACSAFEDAFCRRYWSTYLFNMLFLYFLEKFSGCCGPLVLNEYGEDTSTFTLLKYLVDLRQHPPWTAVNRTVHVLSSSSASYFSYAFYTVDPL